MPAAFGSIVGFFLLGAALLSIGIFVSSLTESQTIAAGICFAVMLINYYLYDLAGFVSSTAIASLAAFSVIVVLAALIIKIMTKNNFFVIGTGLILEIILLIFYLTDSTAFEGLFAEIIQNLSLFERFYIFVDGVFDITGIAYFLTVSGVFLFLTVQSLDKRRWSA